MLVYLIRHGQSYNTHPDPSSTRSQTEANPPLTPIGRIEAGLVGGRLSRLAVSGLYCSPMIRAVETATIIGGKISSRPKVWPECYEHRPTGGYRCAGARDLAVLFPSVELPREMPVGEWIYGDESVDHAIRRADDFVGRLRGLAQIGPTRRIAVVTHGEFTRIVLSRLFRGDVDCMSSLCVDNTAVTTISFLHDRIEILSLNDSSHLAGHYVDSLAGITR